LIPSLATISPKSSAHHDHGPFQPQSSSAALDGDTAAPYTGQVFECIETPYFTRILDQYLDDDEYSVLQAHLNANPEIGVAVPGSGGVRKLRVRQERQGNHPRARAEGDEKGD
jgi:hypothetical protein